LLPPSLAEQKRTAENAVKALERADDDRLLIRAAQDNRLRFAELYERNFDRVYAFIARRVSSREEAQDLTGEVFHQALASIENFKWQGAPFIAWLYGIAANVLSAHWQKLGRSPTQLDEDWDQGGSDEIERRAILAELVESLLPDQRTVIVRRFIEQRSIREIAEELGRSEGAIKQLQLRALENLRAKMGRRIV
jgi:RNA polymerase sigma-70 factor, ECF subfamily